MTTRKERLPDVLVLGGGLIGLASALACARRGLRVQLVQVTRPGQASPAAAGLLAPTLEHTAESDSASAYTFAILARDRYPDYIEGLAEQTGQRVPLDRSGILEYAANAAELRVIAERFPKGETLDSRSLTAIEPALSHAAGAVLHPNDGFVDNVLLLSALRDAVGRSAVSMVESDAAELRFQPNSVTAVIGDGTLVEAAHVVVAAGAWVAQIRGLPRPLPVQPSRGQMLAYDGRPVRRAIYGPNGYLVPRAAGVTLAGSTMENAGFDAQTTAAGLDGIRAMAESLCPSLGTRAIKSSWAGLRPVTPDLLPIICAEPEQPSLIYACGHSRNGVLLAPITADCVSTLAAGDPPPHDLSPFAVTRFVRRGSVSS